MIPEEDETTATIPPYGENHPFNCGQPLWVYGDNVNCWIAQGFYRNMLSEWYCVAVPEDNLVAQPRNIPCSWLTAQMPGEPRYDNVVFLKDYRRVR